MISKYDTIIRPVISEKATLQKENINQVTFEVNSKANRIEIKNAIENIFNVGVEKVNTIHVKGKIKQRGKIIGKRKDWKKAVIKLKPGSKIEFFEGV
jgi:large subunit ribosomal protein L23